jgi:hypothetical protein
MALRSLTLWTLINDSESDIWAKQDTEITKNKVILSIALSKSQPQYIKIFLMKKTLVVCKQIRFKM